jgi:hypothetical protein
MAFRILLVIGLASTAVLPAAHGQIVLTYPGIPRFDAGVQFNSYLSLESNVNAFHFASSGQQDLRTTEAFFGPRIGYTSREAGVYLKVLPGFIHFPRASDQTTTPLNPSTHFAFDTGVVLLRYFPNHAYVRFDGGATIINYGSGCIWG